MPCTWPLLPRLSSASVLPGRRSPRCSPAGPDCPRQTGRLMRTSKPTEPAHRRTGRQARLAVLSALIFFLLTQAGIGLLVAFRMPSVRDPYYLHKVERLKQRIEETNAPLTVVMLGSSR